jgi:hypothetical protein
MTIVLKYRGREVTDADAAFLRDLVERNQESSRFALSRMVCEAWNWVQPNGALKDMVCRGLMLELHRAGRITLPAPKQTIVNPLVHRRRPSPVAVDATPVRSPLQDLLPLEFRQVRRTKDEADFNGLIEAHHYLCYMQPVGEHLKYMVYSSSGTLLACLAWQSAPRHLKPRDSFIGWSKEERRRNIELIAYNTRYLILPWVQVPHLASHILGRMAKLLPLDWKRLYNHEVVFLETFIDPERYRGTCYKAANWVALGRTTGRGKDDMTHKANRPVKEVMGYPLNRRFREILRG